MANAKDITIGLDIGHGENTFDTGSKGVKVKGVGYEEHHFNSRVGIIAERRLKQIGFKVVKGQEPYKVDVPLRSRTNLYNGQKCNAVVSIHANAHDNKSAKGFGVYYWSTSTTAKKMADIMLKHFKATVKGVGVHGTGVHKSVKGTWSDFHMCREPKMVSILCEFGFMTNAEDFEYIFGKNKDQFAAQCAEAIVKTVCEYFGVKYVVEPKPEPVKPQTPAQANNGNYKIQVGDTFYSLSKKFGVDVAAIQKSNPGLNPRQLQVGTYIKIPNKNVVEHILQKGETLYGLSVKYKVTVEAIQKVNPDIKDVKGLQIGQVVKIPV